MSKKVLYTRLTLKDLVEQLREDGLPASFKINEDGEYRVRVSNQKLTTVGECKSAHMFLLGAYEGLKYAMKQTEEGEPLCKKCPENKLVQSIKKTLAKMEAE